MILVAKPGEYSIAPPRDLERHTEWLHGTQHWRIVNGIISPTTQLQNGLQDRLQSSGRVRTYFFKVNSCGLIGPTFATMCSRIDFMQVIALCIQQSSAFGAEQHVDRGGWRNLSSRHGLHWKEHKVAGIQAHTVESCPHKLRCSDRQCHWC
jgi:hypothetical protein